MEQFCKSALSFEFVHLLHAFKSSADFIIIIFFKSSRNTIRLSNSLEPDQARHFVGPDLGSNCLLRRLAVYKCHIQKSGYPLQCQYS